MLQHRNLESAASDAPSRSFGSSADPREGSLSARLANLEEVYRRDAAERYVAPFADAEPARKPQLQSRSAPESQPAHDTKPLTAKAERPQPSPRSYVRPSLPARREAPAKPQTAPGGPGKGGGTGTGGRGPGGAPPLHQRLGDRDFRDVLSKGLAACRRNLVTVAIFSFFVNTLVLAIPIYLFNISDRVLTSRSIGYAGDAVHRRRAWRSWLMC